MHVSICMGLHVFTCVHICIVHICMRTHVCAHICMFVHTYTSVGIYVGMIVCACLCVCILTEARAAFVFTHDK